jgi:carbamoyl-phosphate synthase large subunit
VFSTSAKGRDPRRDSVRLRRKAVELSIPCITAVDTANVLVDCLRSDHDLKKVELVDIAAL